MNQNHLAIPMINNRFASLRAFITSGAALLAGIATSTAGAQTRSLPRGVERFVSVDAPVVALTHVRLVDGTGAPARTDQTIIIRGERIAAVAASGTITVPTDARSTPGSSAMRRSASL